MNVKDLNFKEEDVLRIWKDLKYLGLKEVPRELIVEMLVQNQDKSVKKWNTSEDHISSNVDLYFKKSNDKQYINAYAVAFSKDGKQFFRRYNRMDYGNILTYKQILNMAQGRGIERNWLEKDENGKVGKWYAAAAMFDFDDKDSFGNAKIVEYRNFDALAQVSQYRFDFIAMAKSMERFMDSVMRGNLTDCALSTDSGSVPLQVYLNPRENQLVFKRPEGVAVEVTMNGNFAQVRDIAPENEKKTDLKTHDSNGDEVPRSLKGDLVSQEQIHKGDQLSSGNQEPNNEVAPELSIIDSDSKSTRAVKQNGQDKQDKGKSTKKGKGRKMG